MKKFLQTIVFFTLVCTAQLDAQRTFNIFCCTNISNVVHPVASNDHEFASLRLRMKPQPTQILSIHNFFNDLNNKKTIESKPANNYNIGSVTPNQAAADIQALRLETTINNKHLLDRKEFLRLEKLVEKEASVRKIPYYQRYICYAADAIPYKYQAFQ